MRVRGNEKFINPYMPIVGFPQNLYRFNNLATTLGPYVNELQFYDPYTGKLGPNISSNSILRDMSDSIQNDSRYKPAIDAQIHSTVYNNGTINIGLIGTNNDIEIVKKILDEHYTKKK